MGKRDEFFEKGFKLVEYYRNHPCVAAYDLLGVELASTQRLILRDIWFKNYTIMVMTRGGGKSNYINSLSYVNGEGLVYLSEFLPPIPNYLRPGEEEVISWDDEIYTSKGFKPINKLCLEKEIQGKKLTTQNGFINKGSNQHSVLTINEDCDFNYKRLDKINPGDRICIQKNQQVFGNNYISINDAYLIGLFVGDGCIKEPYTPSISTEDRYIIDFCENYCIENNVDYRIDEDKRTKNTVKFNFKNFSWFFDKYNLDRCLSYDKCVPYSIRTATKESQTAFLKGYFDADGTVDRSKGAVSCCSVSKKLLQEIQIMVLNFGIVSKIRKKKTKSNFGKAYILDILSDNSYIFKELVGFNLNRKQEILDKYLENKILNSNKNTIPYIKKICKEVVDDYRDLNGCYRNDYRLPSLKFSYWSSNEVSYTKLHKFICSVNKAINNGYRFSNESINKIIKLKDILYYNYYFDTVYSVEDWTGDCYDFEMNMGNENEPNYFSNGFINHNTFLLGVASALQALLYPGQRVGLISGTFRQAKKIFAEVEKFYSRSYIFKEAVAKGPTHGSDSYRIEFKNVNGFSSFIESLPLGDGCLTSCNYLTYFDRFGKISDAHDLNIKNNHYINRQDIVWGNNKFRESDKSLCNGVKNTIKIKTHKGFFSEGTYNHEFRIFRNGKIIWCRFDKLRIGDKVLIDKSYRWHYGSNDVTEEQAYALGALIGDGSYTNKYKSRFTTLDKEILYKVIDGSGLDFKKTKEDYHFDVHGKDVIRKWLDFWDIDFTYTKDKKLPEKILSSERPVMSSCIRGLMDTDGYIQVSTAKGGVGITIGFTNTSEELINQLHYILLHYGIVAYKKSRDRDEKWNTIHELLITGSDVKIFYEEIGFGVKRKQSILETAIKNKTKWLKNYHIPGVRDYMIEISNKNRIKKGYGSKESKLCRVSNIKNCKKITPYIVDCFLKSYSYTKDPLLNKIRKIANPDIYYDEIVSIEESQNCTYDIHVPDGNEYCANGFFSHNSKIRGSRFYFIVIDELAQVDPTVLDTVIRPMAATARDPMERAKRYQRNKELYEAGLISKEELDLGNQDSVNRLIYASSGYFKFNHMWSRMSYFWNKIEEAEAKGEKPKHAVWQVPYWDLPEGFLEADIIEESKNEMSDIEFRMEYCAEMVKDSEGFFRASLLESCVSDECDIEIAGEAGAEYILGVDPNQGGSDNCGLAVIKLYPDKNKIVHVRNLNAKETKNIASAIKKICRNFNIVRVFIDKGGGGSNVSEWLAEKTEDGPPILTYEMEHHKNMSGRMLVNLINFSPSWISEANFSLASMMESNKIVFPGMPKNNKVDVENIYENVIELKTQLLNIVVTSNKQGTLHFDTPKKHQHKDLYSALLLASYGIKALELESYESYSDFYGQGGFVRPRNQNSNWNIVYNDGAVSDNLKQGLHAAVLSGKKKK